MNNEVIDDLSRGIYPRIYSPVGFACVVGSNRLNQRPRLLLKGGGGSFRKGGANPSSRGPAGARVGSAGPTWLPLAPPSRRVSSRMFLNPLATFPVEDMFPCFFCTRVPLFQLS